MADVSESTVSVGVYLRRGKYFIFPYFLTTAGVSVDGIPLRVVEETAPDEALGIALSNALDSRTQVLEHRPELGNEAIAPLLAEAGVRSYSAFAKLAEYLSIRRDSSGFRIVPTRKERSAFLSEPGRTRFFTRAVSSTELAAAVREVLAAEG